MLVLSRATKNSANSTSAGMLLNLLAVETLQPTTQSHQKQSAFRAHSGQKRSCSFCRGHLLVLCHVAVPEKTSISPAAMLNTVLSLFTDIGQTILQVYFLHCYFDLLCAFQFNKDICAKHVFKSHKVIPSCTFAS